MYIYIQYVRGAIRRLLAVPYHSHKIPLPFPYHSSPYHARLGNNYLFNFLFLIIRVPVWLILFVFGQAVRGSTCEMIFVIPRMKTYIKIRRVFWVGYFWVFSFTIPMDFHCSSLPFLYPPHGFPLVFFGLPWLSYTTPMDVHRFSWRFIYHPI